VERVSVGLSVRDEHLDGLLALGDRSVVDVLEVMIDDGLRPGPRRDAWRRLGAKWPLLAHGTELGIGDAAGPSPAYLRAVGSALREVHAQWYSEHLSFLRAGGVDLGHFAPGDGDDFLAALQESAAAVAAACPCPVLLENPADVLGWGADRGASWLGASYRACLDAAGAGALLDLTNLVLSARNDGYRAEDFLEALDWSRVVEVHLAGGRHDGTLWIDSHDHDVDDEALGLLGDVARRAPSLRAVVIERDEHVPPLDRMLDEVARVREVVSKAGRR
jgi:uncharacterized protein (UPF0276 family)